MKKVVGGVIGAVLGYLVVALTLGWFITNESILAFCYLAGVIAGGALGVKQASRRRASVDASPADG